MAVVLAVLCPLTAYAAEEETEDQPEAEAVTETEQVPVPEDQTGTETAPETETETGPEAEQTPADGDQTGTSPETETAPGPQLPSDQAAAVVTVSVGGAVTEYADFAAAWAAAASAGAEAVMTLLADATVTQELVLDSGNSIVFEGGEHALTLEKGIIVGPDADPVTFTLTEQSDDKLTVNSGTIQSGETLDAYLIDVCGGALELNGGDLTSAAGDAVKIDAGTATVNGGTVTASKTEGSAIVVDEIFDLGGALTVNDGTITGQQAGVFAFGDVTVTGGTITGGTGLVSQGRGETYTGAVRTSDLVFTGGTVTGTAGAGLALADGCTAILSGGTFAGSTYALACLAEDPIVGLPIEQTLTVNTLLAPGCGFFDGANAPVAPGDGQKELAGPVTVAALPAATAEPTATPTPTAEPTATPAPTAEPTATPAPTVTPTATPAPTAAPTATPAPTAAPGATAVPTATPPAAPATGDSSGLLPAAVLLLGCAAGLAAVVVLLLLRHHLEK